MNSRALNDEVVAKGLSDPEDFVPCCESCGNELTEDDPEGVYCLECQHDSAENQIMDR